MSMTSEYGKTLLENVKDFCALHTVMYFAGPLFQFTSANSQVAILVLFYILFYIIASVTGICFMGTAGKADEVYVTQLP